MTKKVLVVSSANMDMVMNVKKVPSAGETSMDDGTYTYIPGGKGANSALAFSRLGAECVFLTKVGNDANGETLLSLYKDEGIDVSFTEKDAESQTGLAVIMVEKSGQNRIIVFPGANQKIRKEKIDKALLSNPDALYMQFEINQDAVVYAANEAKKKNIPVFIDAGAVTPDFDFSLLPELEMISPNETETVTMTGINPDTEEKCFEAGKKILSFVKAKYAVIKLGSRGVFVYDGKRGEIIPPFDIKVVDTTAAGDAFTAALTLEYLRSKDMFKSAIYANAAGAITVSRKGASSSIPTFEEVEEFLKIRKETNKI